MCRPIRQQSKQSTGIHQQRFSTVIAILFAVLVVALPALISEVIGGWTRKYTSPIRFRPNHDIPDLTGKVAIVTGSNTGIGYHTALSLAGKGAHVIAAARSEAKGRAAIAKMEQEISNSENKGKLTFVPLDLSSLDSVQRFAEEFKALDLPLHVLILNAGVMKSPGSEFIGQNLTYGFDTTADGFEMHIGVNHIGHVHLTNLLLDKLKDSAPSRVVSVSSMAERGSYKEGFRFSDWRVNGMPESYEDGRAYGQSKLANVVWTKELAYRLNGTGVTAYSCHPGVIDSDLGRYLETELSGGSKTNGRGIRTSINRIVMNVLGEIFTMAMFSAKDGALTQLHLATAPISTLISGQFYHPIGRVEEPMHPLGKDEQLRKMLWDETQLAIQLGRDYRK
jgi:NAD(P)-dependent dehydrogenase (short-subunit alcohol dehydrogenase family)